MSFFPSDWDDEDFDDSFDSLPGEIDALASDFESRNRENFTARELIQLYRYYTTQWPNERSPFLMDKYTKMVIEMGIQSFPYIPIFTLHMVEHLLRDGKYRKSHKYLDEAEEYIPLEPSLAMMRSIVHSHEGARKLAFDKLKDTLEMIGNDEALLEDFLEMTLHFEQFELVDPIAKKTVQCKGDVIPILERYLHRSDEPHLVKMLIPAIEAQIDAEPYMAHAWYCLGLANHSVEKYQKSVEAFDYAVTINENFADAWLGMIESLYELSEFQRVKDEYIALKQRFPKKSLESAQGLYAWSLHELGESESSREEYKQIIRLHPTDGESWYSLGLTYHHNGQHQLALPYLEKAYQIDALEVDYGVVLASAYFGCHMTEKWTELYTELSEQFPFESEVWLDWGIALHETGDSPEALQITEKGLENNPHSIQLLYRLASLFYLTGSKDMGLMILEKALEIDSSEYQGIFTFAPELKNSVKIITLISKFTQGKNTNE